MIEPLKLLDNVYNSDSSLEKEIRDAVTGVVTRILKGKIL